MIVAVELLEMFDTLDTDDDRRLSLPELEAAIDKLEEWGLECDDAVAEFEAMDLDGGGHVLFDEFAAWALKHGVDHDTNDDAVGEDLLVHHHKLMSDVAEDEAKVTAKRLRAMAKRKASVRGRGMSDLTAQINMRATIAKLQIDASDSARMKLFESFDINHNSLLSLNEVMTGLQHLFNSRGVVLALEPAIKHAFHAARDTKTWGSEAEQITIPECVPRCSKTRGAPSSGPGIKSRRKHCDSAPTCIHPRWPQV